MEKGEKIEKKSKKVTTVFTVLLFGIAVVALGIHEFDLRPKVKSKQGWVEQKLKKNHNLKAASLVQVLQSNYNIETYAKNPQLIYEYKNSRDTLTSEDKSALDKLINKITTQ